MIRVSMTLFSGIYSLFSASRLLGFDSEAEKDLAAFHVDESSLEGAPPDVVPETRGADHTVAGNQNRYGIHDEEVPDLAHGPRVPREERNLSIRVCFAEGDASNGLEDGPFERRESPEIQRQNKSAPPLPQIFENLALGPPKESSPLREKTSGRSAGDLPHRLRPPLLEMYRAQTAIRSQEPHGGRRRLDPMYIKWFHPIRSPCKPSWQGGFIRFVLRADMHECAPPSRGRSQALPGSFRDPRREVP